MDFYAELQVKDKPGALLSVIEPVSMIGGNIITIVHNRDNTFQDNISLSLTIDMEQNQINKLLVSWKDKGISVVKLSEYAETYRMDYMLIGNLTGLMLEELSVKIRSEAKILKMNIEISAGEKGFMSVILSIDFSSRSDLAVIDGILSSVAKKSNLVYIRGLSQ